MPAAIQTFCTSRLEAPAARVAPAAAAAAQAGDADQQGQPVGAGLPGRGERGRGGERRGRGGALRGEPAGRYDAAHRGEQQQHDGGRRWVSSAPVARTPARTPAGRATAHHSAAPIPADLVAGAAAAGR